MQKCVQPATNAWSAESASTLLSHVPATFVCQSMGGVGNGRNGRLEAGPRRAVGAEHGAPRQRCAIGQRADPRQRTAPAVVAGYGRELRQEVPGYRLDAIAAALEHFSVVAPDGAGEGIDAVGAFVEYLALDALIGNTDRHHTNWGITRRVTDGRMTLSPSFDHATSLGFQLSEAGRARYLREAGGVAG